MVNLLFILFYILLAKEIYCRAHIASYCMHMLLRQHKGVRYMSSAIKNEKKDYKIIREYNNEYSCHEFVVRIVRKHIQKNHNLK